jgi:hypothetical protein
VQYDNNEHDETMRTLLGSGSELLELFLQNAGKGLGLPEDEFQAQLRYLIHCQPRTDLEFAILFSRLELSLSIPVTICPQSRKPD